MSGFSIEQDYEVHQYRKLRAKPLAEDRARRASATVSLREVLGDETLPLKAGCQATGWKRGVVEKLKQWL
ncbi:hypothetical protein LTR66_017820 [Elasticomyces elasticus]|nr:hypothetical protein LTR66_017820 [Elasticomyces elasticus]